MGVSKVTGVAGGGGGGMCRPSGAWEFLAFCPRAYALG
jgi:hypothetical protein